MIRVAVTEESKSDSSYQMLLVAETDTVKDVLVKRNINPTTKNIFLNGKRMNEESFDKPLRKLGSGTIFLTIKFKTIDKPRRASFK